MNQSCFVRMAWSTALAAAVKSLPFCRCHTTTITRDSSRKNRSWLGSKRTNGAAPRAASVTRRSSCPVASDTEDPLPCFRDALGREDLLGRLPRLLRRLLHLAIELLRQELHEP